MAVHDDQCGEADPILAADSNHNVGDLDKNDALDPGELWFFHCQLSTTEDLVHTATVTAVDAHTSTPIEIEDSGEVQSCGVDLELEKTALQDAVPVGSSATFELSVTNQSSEALVDISLDDIDVPDCSWTFARLEAGETRTVICEAIDLEQDLLNRAVANAYDLAGSEVGPVEDEALVLVFENAGSGTGTPGYWKNHPEAWPVQTLEIGGLIYTREAALALLWQNTSKDKTFVMFRSLVSALLNQALGNESSCITQTLDEAQDWLAEHGPVGAGVKGGGGKSPWRVGRPLHQELDDYNNGRLCAPARD